MPDAAAEGGDVNLAASLRIGRHPMAPLEVVPGNCLPGQSAIRAPPCRAFEARRVERTRVFRIDGDVINMLVAIQHSSPGGSTIDREIDAAILRRRTGRPAPRGKVQARWIARIDGESVRAVHSPGQPHSRPMLRAIE